MGMKAPSPAGDTSSLALVPAVCYAAHVSHERAYRYRLYPTPEQEQILARTFGCVRFVYNWALKMHTDAYSDHQERVSYAATSAVLTDLKKQDATLWLNEVSSVPLQQTLRHLDRAFRHFFAGRTQYPTFKKKRNRQAATYVASAFTWDAATRSLQLAKMDAPLNIVWSRDLPTGTWPSTVTVTQNPSGRYFVSILVEEEVDPLPITTQMAGIDLGIHDVVTLSTGEKTDNERFFPHEEKKLAHAQRDLSRKKPGSQNRNKARIKVAKIHAQIADRRRDFLHKLTTKLMRENQVVCCESLAVKNLIRNHHLAKAIADVGWGSWSGSWNTRRPGTGARWWPSTDFTLVPSGAMSAGTSWTICRWRCGSGSVRTVTPSMIVMSTPRRLFLPPGWR
jgi:putative transposase